MNIYSIYLSEDGLHRKCYTNAKVLHGALSSLYEGAERIEFYNADTQKFIELPFSYPNILKAIKTQIKNDSWVNFDVICKGGSRMQIKELEIISK